MGNSSDRFSGTMRPRALKCRAVRALVITFPLVTSVLVVALLAPEGVPARPLDALPGQPAPGIFPVMQEGLETYMSNRPYSEGSSDCGLTRTIRVRTPDGAAAAGVIVRVEAYPASSGGPEMYGERAVGCPADARPVLTGTLTARTDPAGQARFERLGRGLWILWMEGEAGSLTVVQREAQGIPPYGTNPAGGGQIELLDPFNEHVSGLAGENLSGVPAEPVAPVQLSSTSSYVLLASSSGWQPTLDLAEGDDPPLPLSSLPVPTAAPALALSTQTVIERAGPGGDALLSGTPVVVSTVAPVGKGVTLPRDDSANSGASRSKMWDRVLLVFGAAILGIGLIVWAASYVRGSREYAPARSDRRNKRNRGRGRSDAC
jgi:hypothetical protein